jgi:tRNA threonylcarbamoyl adenosine modification protein (Sua5/YciO/YrdC/YwlC family)
MTPSPALLDEIAAVLHGGGIALLPTDTIYGLHAIAANEAAVARIAAIKGRDEAKRFVVIAASADDLTTFGAAIPDVLRSIWPAPLTAIVPYRHTSVDAPTTLAVRVPALDWLRELLSRTGPLVSTSANRSGEAPVKSPGELAHDLQKTIDFALDLGVREGEPSTIVDFTDSKPSIVREGDRGFAQFLRKTLRISL